MTINVYDNYQWKTPKAMYVWNANAWTETKSVSIYSNGSWHTLHNTAVISSNVTNANLYSIMGSPTEPINIKVTVAAGVWVTSVNANVASFSVSGFPAGSRIYLVNQGTIRGATGNTGWPGGNAISTVNSLTINNTGSIIGGSANAIVSAGQGYYLSGSSLTNFENSGTLLGLVK